MKRIFISFAVLLTFSSLFGQWKLIGNMKDPRSSFTAVRIGDKVYLCGGRSSGNALSACESFDLNTLTFKPIAPMIEPRLATPGVVLPDNTIYIPSGISNLTDLMTSTCEIYDPKTDSWSYTTSLNEAREGVANILLNDSLVLMAAGALAPNGPYRKTCELYNVKSKEVTFTGSLSTGQFAGPVFLDTSRNKVTFISGHYNGQHGTWLRATEEYDIKTGTWTVAAFSSVEHGGGNGPVVLPNGEIVVPGGDIDPQGAAYAATDVIEIYTPSTHTWRTLSGKLRIARFGGITVYMGGDSVMVIGGYSPTFGALDDCEIINVKTGTVTQGPKLNQARLGHWVTMTRRADIENPCCGELKIYVFGGESVLFGNALASCEVLSVKSAAESPLSFAPSLSLQGTVCNGIDTTLKFTNTGCASIVVDSVTVDGLNATVTGYPAIVRLNEDGSFPIKLASSTGGTSNGRARIYYRSSCTKHDTSIAITANFITATKGTIRPIISDVPNGRDTVEMPLYLVNNTGDVFNAFEIVLGYNKNLLEAISPRFDGTLAEGALLADVTSSASGASIFVAQTVALSVAKPLCILRFVSHLSDTACTTVRLEGLTLEDANGNSCIYAVRKDSALICRTLAVGSPNTRSFCTPFISELRYDAGARVLRFSVDACTNGVSAELYDLLGKPVAQASIRTAAEQQLHVSNIANGVYCLVVRNADGATMQKLLIER